jgi:hypothetical protein
MSIALPSAPLGGLNVVRRSLAARGGRTAQLDPGIRNLKVGPPMPLYVLRGRDALRPRPLRAARLVSWEYPLFGGEQPCIVSMRAEPDGLDFGGIIHGFLPSRLLDAAAVAERALDGHKQAYCAKLVECPPLRLLLFVAQARRGPSAVIPLVQGTLEDRTESLVLSWGLRRLLAARAAAVRSGPEAAKSESGDRRRDADSPPHSRRRPQ